MLVRGVYKHRFSRGFISAAARGSNYRDKFRNSHWKPPRFVLLCVAGAAVGALSTWSTSSCAPTSALSSPSEFCQLCSDGDLAGVKTSYLRSKNLVHSRHEFGWSALHAAVANNHLDIVEFLLENGADVNSEDKFAGAHTEVQHFYRRRFCSSLPTRFDTSGWTSLHFATAFGLSKDTGRIIDLLINHGADIDKRNSKGETPIALLDSLYNANKDTMAISESRFHSLKSQLKTAALRNRVRFPLDEQLHKVMVGQVMPIRNVTSAVRRRENGWHDASKPLVLLFLGSSGVGKTMLAKQLARSLNKNEDDGFIRLDMSEYGESHQRARLIGSPPGYVGHEQGGQLTDKLTKCPEAIVLLDEIEKAHPDVLNVLLQVFDEGRLTDGKGQTVHFPNAVFIMTSNLVQVTLAK